jgi:hypothetical protein
VWMASGRTTAPHLTSGRGAPPPLSGWRRQLLQAVVHAAAVVLQVVEGRGRVVVAAVVQAGGQRRRPGWAGSVAVEARAGGIVLVLVCGISLPGNAHFWIGPNLRQPKLGHHRLY